MESFKKPKPTKEVKQIEVEAPKPLPEYKPSKQEEFLNAVPEKFRDYASELLKGGNLDYHSLHWRLMVMLLY